jgi:hypothetical protein
MATSLFLLSTASKKYRQHGQAVLKLPPLHASISAPMVIGDAEICN